jgi:uncharacterized protein
MQKYKDCYNLARSLPYFRIKNNKIYLKLKTKIIDFHTHLGFSYAFSKPIKYLKKMPETKYMFPERNVPVDLNLYSGVNTYRYIKRKRLFSDNLKTLISSKGHNSTQTIPNLLEEMDRYKIEKSIVLAVDIPFSSRISREYLKYKEYSDRLLFFCFITNLNLGWRKKMRSFVEKGAIGLKIHPMTMLASPDKPKTMRLIKEWSKYNLPVLFHCGYSGIEPSIARRWMKVENYEKPIKTFPEIIFILGHSGCVFHKKAIAFAKKYPNVYLELSGQSPENVKDIIKGVDNDRILFGSDWPFYPIILPLSKVLIGTENNKKAREKILYKNADALIKKILKNHTNQTFKNIK